MCKNTVGRNHWPRPRRLSWFLSLAFACFAGFDGVENPKSVSNLKQSDLFNFFTCFDVETHEKLNTRKFVLLVWDQTKLRAFARRSKPKTWKGFALLKFKTAFMFSLPSECQQIIQNQSSWLTVSHPPTTVKRPVGVPRTANGLMVGYVQSFNYCCQEELLNLMRWLIQAIVQCIGVSLHWHQLYPATAANIRIRVWA